MLGDARDADFRDYIRVVWTRRWVVVAAVVVVAATAATSSVLQHRVYEGKAQLLLQPRATESLFDPNTGQRNDPLRQVQTELEVVKSQPVRVAVAAQLGSAPDVSVNSIGQTDVIEVRASSTVPRRAADAANAYANAYIDFRRRQAVNDVLGASQEIQSKITDLQRQIDNVAAQIANASGGDRAVAEQNLGPRRDALVNQQALFKQRLDQLQVDAALKTGGAQLVTPAEVPTSPVKPARRRIMVLATIVGLLFGVGLAFLFDYLDDSLKSKEDLENLEPDVPTLSLIPALPDWRDRATPRLVTRVNPTSPASEAYRTLRTSIDFMALDRPMRTLQITSPSSAEGKTTTLANLGLVIARAGKRVVLVDCDLRRPRINEFFGLKNSKGFTSVLLGDLPLSGALQQVPGEERLRLLSSGPLPPNPSELLSSRRTVEVFTALQAGADVVLIDSPPVLPVTDAAVLSGRVDATLLVASARKTTRKELARAVEILQQVDAPLVGMLLNNVTEEAGYGYAYKYEYYRHDEPKAANGRRAHARGAAKRR